ncbi:MAG TPA: pitrilysin family protein [Gemmatimonadales bacterium]
MAISPLSLPGWTQGVRREVLPNGLTLLVLPERSARVAALVTHVKAGFFDEPDKWVGISHVLEHMFFKGTLRRRVGEIAKETKAAGGYLNASTSYDHTSYIVALPSSSLQAAIDIQADALQHSLIDPDELRRELGVVIQEARRKLDTPAALTAETLHETLYDRHRMRRWRIGREEDLAKFTREDVLGYYKSRYVPSRTIVGIVGDVDPEAALDLARAAYGNWAPAPGAIDLSPAEPDRHDVRGRTLRADVTLSELAIGWQGVPALDRDAVALDLAAAILGAGRGSWLYQGLREAGIATSVGAHHYSPTEIGVFSIGAEFEPARMEAVLEAMAAAVNRLTTKSAPAADLERARALLLTRWARRMESMVGRAAALAGAEALEDISLLDREFQELATIDGDRVCEAAARILLPDRLAAVVCHPRDRGDDLTPSILTGAFSRSGTSSVRELSAVPAPVRAPRTIPSRVEAGLMHAALPAWDLLIQRKPGVPTVSLGLYVPRLHFEPASQAGLGALTIRSAIRGAGEFDAAGLAFAFERLGGSLASSVTYDWFGFGTTVLAPNLAEAAGLLRSVFREPLFRDEQVRAEQRLLAEEAAQVTDDMFRYPFQLAFGAAFGDRGYGVPVIGFPDTVFALTPEDVRAWHRTGIDPLRGVVVAVGDLTPEQARDALAGVFGDDAARTSAFRSEDLPWFNDGEPVERVVNRSKAQTAVAMVFPGPSRRSPQRLAAELWAAIASGLGGRLFEALRDKRSLAYTVVASSWQKGRGGALLTYIATAPEREAEARSAMLEELSRFAVDRVTAEELNRARNYLAGQVDVERQSASALASEIVEAWLTGNGLADLEGTADRYRAVTAEQVLAVAEQFPRGLRAEGIVRGVGGGR